MFVAHYYSLFDQEPALRHQLGGLYTEADSFCSCGGGPPACGRAAIVARLAALEHTVHTAGHIDCQPFPSAGAGSGCLLLVSGAVRCGGSAAARAFSESFVLLPGPAGTWLVANQVRQVGPQSPEGEPREAPPGSASASGFGSDTQATASYGGGGEGGSCGGARPR